MKSKSNPFVIASLAVFTVFTHTASAVDIIKQDNATALNLDASWTTVQPTATDVAVWDATVLAANTSALGGDLSWQGIRIASPSGLVTVTHAANNILTLGTSGIDMSAATQNLTLMSAAVANTAGTLAIGGAQTWNVATGATLTLFSTSNSANQRLSGSGNIAVSGGGTVTMNVGDLGSTTFAAGNGNDTYTGNWNISGGSKVISLRNGSHAWGQGSITLDNGTISQQQGNWSFNNNITIGAGGGTITSDSSGTGRHLNLTGAISGSGALQFNSLAAMTTNEGHILTGANTHNGTMLINANATVRIGGDATTTTNSTAAGTLGSINSAVAITNNGILGFGRTDAHTFGNAISGTGVVRLGRVGGTLPANQVVTLSVASSYTGATQVNAGRLNLTGSLTSAITVLGTNSAAISGTGSTTGLLTTSAGSIIALAGGATTTSLTSNGVTFGGATVVNFLTTPTAATTYDVVTYGAGAVTNFPANLTAAAHGTLSDNVGAQKIQFAADGAQTRTWDSVTGTWVNGGITDLWQEGDQDFYNLDSVIFSEPAAAAVVTLSGRLTPTAVTVNNTINPYTFTGNAGTNDITGASSLTKNNGGTLAIATQQTYTGGTTINGGVVDLTGGGGGGGAIRGTVTVESGAVLRLSTGDATGYNTDASRLSVINLNGGTLNVNTASNQTLGSATINMTGGSITGIAGSNLDFFANGSAVNTLASATESTINLPSMNLRQNDTLFTIADGTATNDLVISSVIGNGSQGNHAMIKAGLGTMKLSALNVFTGNVTVNAGVLDLTGGGLFTSAFNSANIVTVNTGGTLKLNSFGYSATASLGQLRDHAGNRVINGGTIEVTSGTESVGNDFSVGASGGIFRYNPVFTTNTLTLAGNANTNIPIAGALTFQTDANISVGEVIEGIGSITKTGSGKLTFSAVNTYSGNTAVDNGTLALVGGSQASPVAVASGATLGFTLGSPTTSTSTVAFNGVNAKVSVTGIPVAATLITATNITGVPVLDPAIPGYELAIEDSFTTLKLKATSSGFSAWASTNAPDQTIDQDHDNDGVRNGVEYFMGLTGSSFTANPAHNASNVVSWPKGTSYTGVYGTHYAIQISSDLGVGDPWTDVSAGNVTIDGDSVDYDLDTAPAGTRKFARLKVTGP